MATSRQYITTEEWERELGSQFRRARLNLNIDQVSLASSANVALGSLKNLESGKGATVKTLIRVTRALGRHDWLLSFEPERDVDLIALVDKRPQEPQRASAKRI